ncbi:hypothetical protein HDV00_004326 [Rhizophlyctis rosea]|nr:hypothetical protein HDV00_004326 [Rhizophlyctis rosea]
MSSLGRKGARDGLEQSYYSPHGPSETTLAEEQSDLEQRWPPKVALEIDDDAQSEVSLNPFSSADEVIHEGTILSVTAYQDLPTLSRVMKARSNQCGLFTKKVPVRLEITKSFIREYALNKDGSKGTVLAQTPTAFMGFALLRVTPDGRCRFLLKDNSSSIGGGSNHRIYEVADRTELNLWYSKIKLARYAPTTPSIRTTADTASSIHHTIPRSSSDLSLSLASDDEFDIPTPPNDPIEFAISPPPLPSSTSPLPSPVLVVPQAEGQFGMELVLHMEARIAAMRASVGEELKINRDGLNKLQKLEVHATHLQGELKNLRVTVGIRS